MCTVLTFGLYQNIAIEKEVDDFLFQYPSRQFNSCLEQIKPCVTCLMM
jgi:hypothetical protein